MLLSLICLPVRNNLFAGQMWLTRVKTSNFRCNFHEVLGISKVSCPRKKKEKKSIGRRRRRRWYSHGACPRNVVGVVKVPIRIRVIFPSLSFSFFFFRLLCDIRTSALPCQNTMLLPIDKSRYLSALTDSNSSDRVRCFFEIQCFRLWYFFN